MKSWIYRFILANLLLLTVFSACAEAYWDQPPYNKFRRPQVMTEWHWDSLVDYDCGPGEEEMECAVIEEESGPLFDALEIPPIVRDGQYVLAPGDILEMAVFEDDDTAIENVVIAPDGNLYYTFFDNVSAAGRTAAELGRKVEEKLSILYINPNVTITPRTSYDKSYNILGRLLKPGVYLLGDHISLLDAIAQAGGFLKESYRERDKDNDLVFLADLKNSFVIREGEKLPVDFDALVFKGDKKFNIDIMPGDYVYIASADAPAIFILGAIRSPQRVRFIEGMRLTQALANISGWSSGLVNQTSGFGGGIALGSSGSGTAFAPDLTRIIVIRGELHNPRVMVVDLEKVLAGQALDLVLQAGDIVYASDKTFRFGRELIRLAIDTFVQAFGTTAGAYYGQQQWFTN